MQILVYYIDNAKGLSGWVVSDDAIINSYYQKERRAVKYGLVPTAVILP